MTGFLQESGSAGDGIAPVERQGGGERRFRLARLPPARRAVLDLLDFAASRRAVHGLVEVDVTAARRQMRALDPAPSLTAFLVASTARAVQAHPETNARRAGGRLLLFREVDLVVTVERSETPIPHVVRRAAARSCREIDEELSAAKRRGGREELRERWWMRAVPGVVRRLAVRAMARRPGTAARFGPPVGVSSLGMFGGQGGWGIPLSPLTLMVTAGPITTRLALEDGAVVEREMLPLTLTFDHAVVDGAPAARFAATLRRLLETGEALAASP